MITLRHGTAAFLRNGGNVLLMKRGEHKEIAPGMWSGIGGHFEENELSTPFEACYREIEEESGIIQSHVHALELQYILMRRFKNEIRQSYIFFGETSQTDIIQTDEGALFWIPEAEWMDREFTDTFTFMLEHYMKREPGDRNLYIGIAEKGNEGVHIHWSPCKNTEL